MQNPQTDTKWWNLEVKEVLAKLKTNSEGLSSAEAQKRLQTYGDNSVSEKKPRTALRIFWEQIQNWLVIALIIASLVSFFLGDAIEALVIITLVLLSVLFGFIQEYKAEKVISDLKKFITNKCRVMRDFKWMEIDSRLLVPGDIIELHIGDKVPADVRLLTLDNFQTDESILTGESEPISKTIKSLNESSLNPNKFLNMAFAGTSAAQGNATGIVVECGNTTFFGLSAQILGTSEPETEFQKQIKAFSLFLFKIIIAMTVFIFLTNTLLKKDILESFLFALALAVGITPEMLPAIITVTLSSWAMKLSKKKVVVKKLSAVEDLGNIDTFCVDKTGTLTDGVFSLNNCLNLEGKPDDNLNLYGSLCLAGNANPVDEAIRKSTFISKVKEKLSGYQVIDENEFDYHRKRMSVLTRDNQNTYLIAKGAFESILSVSTYASVNGKKAKLDSKLREKIRRLATDYETQGFHVIAVSEKKMDSVSSALTDEKDMTLEGFLLFKDPVKATACEAIKKFIALGVNLKVLSGDSPVITENISREAGIIFNKDEVVTSDYLENLPDDQFAQVVAKAKIFAGITPEQKYKIVESLNIEGHIVGFLGDGVNDVPALRAADVGISVDTGAQIAKDAADIILLEKDLKVLADGIEGGRKTFGNIMKYILNTISANYGNMFTVAISSLFLPFIPLLPSQILLNNFLSDVPQFAVATDRVDANYTKKPKRWNLGFIKSFMIYYGFVSSFFDLFLILPMILIFKVPVEVFRTAWFVESAISEMIVTFAIRTKMPFYKSRPSNWLMGLTALSVGVVVSMPFLGLKIFSFVAIPLHVWVLILIDLVAYFTVTELVKKRFFAKFESGNNVRGN